MAVPLIPPASGANAEAVLKALYDAVRQLQDGYEHVALKTGLPPADDYRGAFFVCDEINSLVHSTAVTGVYAWLRADGSAL